MQSDNQLSFQQIEKLSNSNISSEAAKINSLTDNEDKILPGTSEPQDLGSVSYKNMSPDQETQQTQSIESTSTILTENFIDSEEKFYQTPNLKNNMNLQQVFLKLATTIQPKELLENSLLQIQNIN